MTALILRTRPATVEARQVVNEDRNELATWVGGWTYGVRAVRWFDPESATVRHADTGDWIVRDVFGRFHPHTDASIAREFDRVIPAVSE